MPYIVRWTETSTHYRELTDDEMAEIKGVSLAGLADLDEDKIRYGLDDDLAGLSDDGFEGLERQIDACTRH